MTTCNKKLVGDFCSELFTTINICRCCANISLPKIAAYSGMSRQNLYNIRSGKKKYVTSQSAIAIIFGLMMAIDDSTEKDWCSYLPFDKDNMRARTQRLLEMYRAAIRDYVNEEDDIHGN